MRKFLVLILLLFGINSANAYNEATFIYLNGSNTNTEKTKQEFIKGANHMHSWIVKRFSDDDFIQSEILNGYKINPLAVDFYWGDMSRNDIEVLDEDFNFLKKLSPKPAALVRKFMAMCLHDAIWVTKPENMYPLVQKLHRVIMKEYANGNKSVLMGYSAGTFIVHQYLLIKMPILSPVDIIPKRPEYKEYIEYTKTKNPKNTCSDAIFRTGIATYGLNNIFVIEDDIQSFKNKIDKLDKITTEICAPFDSLIGAINFASPYVLFYSDLFDKNRPANKLLRHSYKYIVENDMFWLTVNYADDPLGFPVSRNANFDEIEQYAHKKVEKNGGFIYDKSDKKSSRLFIGAHLSYFPTSKKYTKILTEAIKEGYEYFYMTDDK